MVKNIELCFFVNENSATNFRPELFVVFILYQDLNKNPLKREPLECASHDLQNQKMNKNHRESWKK